MMLWARLNRGGYSGLMPEFPFTGVPRHGLLLAYNGQ